MFRFASVLLLSAAGFAAVPEQPLRTLRAGHPRLIALDTDIARLKDLIRTDPSAAEMFAALKRQAETILLQEPVVHRLIGPRLLDQSRRALDRIYTLALVYRIEGDRRSLDGRSRNCAPPLRFRIGTRAISSTPPR